MTNNFPHPHTLTIGDRVSKYLEPIQGEVVAYDDTGFFVQWDNGCRDHFINGAGWPFKLLTLKTVL